MAEEGSVIILTHWKLRRVDFSVSHLSLFFFTLSPSLSPSHSLSHSHKLINLFYTLTLFTLVINSIELIWTSPFQNILFSPGHVSHLSLSLTFTCDWVWCATWLGLFFVPFFDHIMSVRMITSWQAVSEWELIIEP